SIGHCYFRYDWAVAGSSGQSGSARGGCIYAVGCAVNVTDTTFSLARPDDPTTYVLGSVAQGGLISAAGARLPIANRPLDAAVREGWTSAQGGSIFVADGTLTLTQSAINAVSYTGRLTGNLDADHGSAQGGAVYASRSTVSVVNSTIEGGAMGFGGDAQGGA